MNKRSAIWASVLVIVILAALGGIKLRARRAGGEALSEPIARGTVVESVYGIGTVTARNIYQLKSGVTNTIQKLYVTEGDQVQKGQALVAFENGNVVFRAPFSGTVTYLPSRVGETVFAQGVVLSLVDLLDRYVVVSLEQRAAVRVKLGQKAKLSFENMREQTFEGTVQSIYSNDGNFFVRIAVQNLAAQLLPGMTADVSIAIAEHSGVLLVPTLAIETGKVLVKRGTGRAIPVELKTGILDGTMAEVISGDVHEGERVVLRTKASP